MKIKITTGGGMGGGVKYINKPDAEFISGTQSTPRDFLRETAALRELRPDIKKPVLHRMLSQPLGEPLTMQQWKEVIEKDLRKNGLEGYSYHAILHHDAKHQNAHILVNMISFDGQRWNSQDSAKRGMKSCTEIEEEMGLTKTRTLADYRRETGFKNRGISTGAMRQFERTGTLPSRTKQAITRRKAAENERNRQDRAAYIEPAAERTVSTATDRPVASTDQPDDATDRATSLENTETTEHRNQDSERELSEVFRRHQTDQQRPEADEKAATEKDFQLTTETDMQKRNGAQAQEIDDEDQPPTLSGRLRAELREEAGKHIFDLYFQGRELPTFCYRPADRSLELLATPTPQNVAAFFDACSEKNMKPLALFGDSQFLQLAVAEAHKRGYPLDLSDPRVKAMNDQLTAAPAPGSVVSVSLNTATSTANMFTAVAEKSMRSARRHI